METIRSILSFFPLVIPVLLLISFIWRKHDFYISFQIIRIGVITTWALFFIRYIFFSSFSAHLERASGPYWWAYLLLTTANLIVPPLLIWHKLGKSKRWIAVIGLFSSPGRIFEIFVIITTSLHRDYLSASPLLLSLFTTILTITCFIVGIDLLYTRFKSSKNEKHNQKNDDVLDQDLDL